MYFLMPLQIIFARKLSSTHFTWIKLFSCMSAIDVLPEAYKLGLQKAAVLLSALELFFSVIACIVLPENRECLLKMNRSIRTSG